MILNSLGDNNCRIEAKARGITDNSPEYLSE
jgi:hypothetical protein